MNPEVFREYDVRGVVGRDLTPEFVRQLGQAIGVHAVRRGARTMGLGRDCRLSSESYQEALGRGIRSAGVDVIDIGLCATPMLYFSIRHLRADGGVMVTGSHNPPEYNGFKMVLAGETLYGPLITDLRRRLQENDLVVAPQPATEREVDVVPAYVARIASDVRLARPLKIAIDCGNGVAGAVAPPLFTALGAEVHPLYCEVDGTFPNHHPDPSKLENLRDLVATVTSGDVELGLAFDGDGDRLGVITKAGQIIFPDRQLMLFAADLLARNPGATILYDVKCTRHLARWIRDHGGQPLMWKTGHAFIKQKLKASGALLAGEMSGHIFFKERWYGFDDGLYAAARLLEILSRHPNPSEVLEALPDSVATPELNIKMGEGEPHQLVEKLQNYTGFTDATEIITLDGVRVEYPDGFGLARASNTTPVLVLRFEADNETTLARIKNDFAHALANVWPGIDLAALS
ncbi:MAG TPA: phosphomannomutase/phosphoglucomutase [Rhodocyclaceae bacterium]|nr:phosphomannomutase/phosphoglucomutase [Rhodocyclaceae bacterium]